MNTYSQRITTFLIPGAEVLSSGDVRYTVAWRSGIHRQGKVQVVVPVRLVDRTIIAELAALQHLLEVESVAGNSATGHRMLLLISQGAIKKLLMNRSTKNHLYPWATFLTTRFAGADCTVNQDGSWLLPESERHVLTIRADYPEPSSFDTLRIGRVGISKHAWERFAQRLNYPTPCELWAQIRRIVSSPSLIPMTASEENQARIVAGNRMPTTRHIDHRTKWIVVVAEDQGRKLILTAYPAIRASTQWSLGHRSGAQAAGRPSCRHAVRNSHQMSLFR